MKTSEAFKLAKQHLRPTGRCIFICHALAEAAYDRSIMAADFDWHVIYTTQKSGFKTAIKTITDRIGNDCSVDAWLNLQGIPVWEMETDDHREQMQAYRHRWLDALIAEFESKGD